MPGTVTVACKLPNGIMLRIFEPQEIKENTIFGPRESRQFFQVGKPVKINGFAHAINKEALAPIRSGFAMTHGVDADFFERWMQHNKDSDLVQNGFIYAAPKAPDAEAHARDYKNERCGFEPVDPDNLPNEFKRKIKTATSTAA